MELEGEFSPSEGELMQPKTRSIGSKPKQRLAKWPSTALVQLCAKSTESIDL